MDHKELKKAAKTITMPAEMRRRIAENCRTQINQTMEEHTMKPNTIFRKPAAVFAALAICLSLSVTALASTGALEGFFRDITDWRGAVVGTTYEQATDEISVAAAAGEKTLTVHITFADPGKAPYREAETLSIAAYEIRNADGKTLQEGGPTEATPVTNGRAEAKIPLSALTPGTYRLHITAFTSHKKADQPLTITGDWELEFVK